MRFIFRRHVMTALVGLRAGWVFFHAFFWLLSFRHRRFSAEPVCRPDLLSGASHAIAHTVRHARCSSAFCFTMPPSPRWCRFNISTHLNYFLSFPHWEAHFPFVLPWPLKVIGINMVTAHAFFTAWASLSPTHTMVKIILVAQITSLNALHFLLAASVMAMRLLIRPVTFYLMGLPALFFWPPLSPPHKQCQCYTTVMPMLHSLSCWLLPWGFWATAIYPPSHCYTGGTTPLPTDLIYHPMG